MKKDGFTGLEAAIVLIAFVIVAAVFSYVIFVAGFFAPNPNPASPSHTSTSVASYGITDYTHGVYYIDAQWGSSKFGTALAAFKSEHPGTVITYIIPYACDSGDTCGYFVVTS